jgi:hypothetical protein
MKEKPMIEPNDAPVPESIPETPQELNETPRPKKRRTGLYIGLGILVIVLAGAAFLAGRLMNGTLLNVPGFGWLDTGPGNAVRIEMGDPPEELPKTSPDVFGQFFSRDDNVLTLSTGLKGGMVVMNVEKSSGGGSEPESNSVSPMKSEGPKVEIVVTQETKIYRDATFDDLKGGPEEGRKIQQKAAESDLDEIGSNSMVTAWGRKSGDRIIADVIFFSNPVLFKKGN